MNNVIAAALELQTVCQEHGWQFCFIGGIAVQRWSEPRFTNDEDLTLLTGFGSEQAFIEPYLKLVRTELKPLAELKEEPEIIARLEQKITLHNQPFTRITPVKPRKKRK